jgi:D-glycero-D-manno-heptose 1,7-bisphosphate phosphatase
VKPAVFVDRDGTLIEQVHHLTDPRDVVLIPGAAEAISELRGHGYACVVVTNQSVIERGLLDEAGLAAVHAAMNRQLSAACTEIDALYYCPVAPTQDDPTIVEDPERKPGAGMLIRAARDLSLDLAASWMVGDNVSDMLAGRNAGCKASVLVRSGHGHRFVERRDCYDYVVEDLGRAASLILETDSGGK